MNIDKPDLLNFSAQPMDREGRLHQSFTIALGVDLATGRALPIDQAYAAAMQALAPGDCLDMGLPKKRAEWLLAGNACAPRGQTASGLTVDVRVGASSRRFLASSETPLAALPLTWAQTWGTEAENPQGLPSAQLHRAPLADANLPFGAPACPGPRGAWPCRMGNMGTYDETWLKTRWPGVPDDFDWGFFNLAQPQQFLPGGLAGDEDIELSGLHPDHARIACRLPGKTVRLFLTRATGESEAAIRLDTLWLFPNQMAGLLFWHGMVPCADESGSDILAVRLTLTPEEPEPAEPEPEAAAPEAPSFAVPDVAGAANAAGAKLAGLAGAAAGVAATATAAAAAETPPAPEMPEAPVADAAPPPPPDIPAEAPPVDLKAELAAQLEESIPEINQGLAEAGLPPLSPEQLEETKQRLNDMAEQIQALQAQAEKPPPELPEVLRDAGVPEDRIQAVQKALDLEMPDPAQAADAGEWGKAVDGYLQKFNELMQPTDDVLNTMRTTLLVQGPGGDKLLEEMAGGPPPTPVEQLVQAGLKPEQAASLVEALEADIPEGPDGLMQYAKKLEEAGGFPEGSVTDRIAAYQAVVDKIVAENPELAAAQAEARAAAEAGADAAGAADAADAATDTAGEAAGEALKAAVEETDLSGPPEDRKGLLALLAKGGSLAGLRLAGFNLSGLDLSGQNLRGTDLKGADLKNTMLDQAQLGEGQLAGADLTGANLAGADLAGADLTGAKAGSASFHGANLAGAKLAGMNAPDADFSGANLAGADLGGGAFVGADFSEAQAPGLQAAAADFSEAKLRFCAMPEANFEEARCKGADFHQTVLDRAAFRRADLAEATFCYGTSVAEADFAGAAMAGGVWTQVRGAGANFIGVKAKGASFADCKLEACRWPGADLRESDFSRTALAGSDMARANLFKASLREADLSKTDLSAANLYGADLCRAKTDPTTNLTGADATNTILAVRAAGGAA